MSGIEGPIDVADMRRNCLVYHIRNEADDAYARMFWEVVEAMSPGDQRLLLKFDFNKYLIKKVFLSFYC